MTANAIAPAPAPVPARSPAPPVPSLLLTLTLSLGLSLVAAGPARALSCLQPDPFAAFDRAADSGKTYVVAQGRFRFDEDLLPGLNGKPASVAARFEGQGLTSDGFVAPLRRRVVLDISCAGAWCGGMVPDRPVLVFLERRQDGLHLDLGACPTVVFDFPDPATLRRIAACFNAGRCTG